MIYNQVSTETLEKVLELANKNDLEVVEKEGSLLNEYLIYNKNLNFGKSKKAYKYIIFKEIYLNEWSSCHRLILTDNEKDIKYFENN